MRPCHRCPHTVSDAAHHHSLMSCCSDDVHLLSTVVYLSQYRLWKGYGLVGSSTEVDTIAALVVNSHYGIVGGVYSHHLSARVSPLWEQRLVDLLSDDAHLAAVTVVNIVYITSVEHLRRTHPRIVWSYSLHGCLVALVACHNRTAN